MIELKKKFAPSREPKLNNPNISEPYLFDAIAEAVMIIDQLSPKNNILHLAARYDCLYLIDIYQHDFDINSKDEEEMEEKTPLHYAIEYQNSRIVGFLLSLGADIYSTDWFGRTPLHYATQFGKDKKIIDMLIEQEAKWGIKDNEGVTPMMLVNLPSLAQRIMTAQYYNLLTEDSSGNTALHHAAAERNYEMVKFWLQQGIKPDQTNNEGQNPWEYFLWAMKLHSISFAEKMSHILEGKGEVYDNMRAIYKLLKY